MRSTFVKASLAALALLATPFAAAAADMPVKGYYKNAPRSVVPYYSWTGFYVGINGGYGWNKADWSASGVTISPNGNGWVIGGTLGYNYQIGNWVFGVEGDWDFANIKGSTACINPAFSCSVTVNSLATLRGRVGYAWNNILLYGTAGWGMAGVKTDAVGPASSTDSQTMSGFVYGAGLEYAFLSNWTAKLEYLHADLGSRTFTNVTPETVTSNLDILRIGVNYKFGGPLFSRF